MKRRAFITAGAAIPALALATRVESAGQVGLRRFALGYHDGREGGLWVPADLRPMARSAPDVQVKLLGVQGATRPGIQPVLSQLGVDLMYRTDSVRQDRPYVWAHLMRRDLYAASRGVAPLLLASNGTSGVRVRYECSGPGGSVARGVEVLPWIDAALPVLTPGYYALVGPCAATGAPPPWWSLAAPRSNACGLGTCDGQDPDFDALVIAVEAA